MARKKTAKQIAPYLFIALPGVLLGAAALAWAYKLDKRSKNATQAIMNVSNMMSQNSALIDEILEEE